MRGESPCGAIPFLVRHGFDYNRELLEQVHSDHCQDRYLIEVLHQAAQRDGRFSKEDRRRVVSTAAALASVQRELLMKQDIELFPEVVSLIDATALTSLQAELSLFDLHAGSRSAHARRLIQDSSDALLLLLLADRRYPRAGRPLALCAARAGCAATGPRRHLLKTSDALSMLTARSRALLPQRPSVAHAAFILRSIGHTKRW